MYAPLFSCPLLSSKLDSPLIKTWEKGFFFSLSECLSNILITGEPNLDERSEQLNRGAYILKLLVTKLVLYVPPWIFRPSNGPEQATAGM